MTFSQPSDLPPTDSPDSAREFDSEIDVNASQRSHASPATPAQLHEAESVGALIRADKLIAGYFPGVNILNEADLFAHEGELVGIIGPNGCWEIDPAQGSFWAGPHQQAGSVTLRGEDITNLRADQLVRRGVGFVPQNNNVFPSLTIEENLEMGSYQDPKSFSERFDAVVSLFPYPG